ncbi:MAG: cupin domain-containing protein [Ilumatobacteraceae bacterium]
MDATDLVARFGLEPIPAEGGFCTQYWRSPPGPAQGPVPERPHGTAIVALLTDEPDGFSQFHRLTVDEIWHFYLGDAAELVLLEAAGTSRHHRLGHDLDGGDELFVVVPAGTWMAARTTGRWSLFGTTMAPGFTSESYEGADIDALIRGWPPEAETIRALTRAGSPRRMPPGG